MFGRGVNLNLIGLEDIFFRSGGPHDSEETLVQGPYANDAAVVDDLEVFGLHVVVLE